jgi:hypothetical protein
VSCCHAGYAAFLQNAGLGWWGTQSDALGWYTVSRWDTGRGARGRELGRCRASELAPGKRQQASAVQGLRLADSGWIVRRLPVARLPAPLGSVGWVGLGTQCRWDCVAADLMGALGEPGTVLWTQSGALGWYAVSRWDTGRGAGAGLLGLLGRFRSWEWPCLKGW